MKLAAQTWVYPDAWEDDPDRWRDLARISLTKELTTRGCITFSELQELGFEDVSTGDEPRWVYAFRMTGRTQAASNQVH